MHHAEFLLRPHWQQQVLNHLVTHMDGRPLPACCIVGVDEMQPAAGSPLPPSPPRCNAGGARVTADVCLVPRGAAPAVQQLAQKQAAAEPEVGPLTRRHNKRGVLADSAGSLTHLLGSAGSAKWAADLASCPPEAPPAAAANAVPAGSP